MKVKLLVGAALLVIAAQPALATLDTLQVFGGPVVKTPPLENSDFCPGVGNCFGFDNRLQLHFGTSYLNWAGVKFTVHWDPTEAKFVGVAPAPGFFLAGFSSAGPSSLIATFLHINASASGIPVFPSSTLTPALISFSVTNTTPVSNSDIDIFLSAAFQIFHTSLSGFSFISSLIAAPGGIGIEHTPEPATALLLFCGFGLLAVARRLGVKL